MRKTLLLLLLINVILKSEAQDSRWGYALQFDGTDDYVELGDVIEGTVAHTEEAWIKWSGNNPNSSAFQDIILKPLITSTAITNTGNLHANYGDGTNWNTGVNSAVTIPVNEWTHIATVRESTGKVRLFINGVEDGNTATITNNGSNSEPRCIGVGKYNGTPNAYNFFGQIDEVRIWNTARTATEIFNNRFVQLSGTELNLVAYYKMDDGSGTSLTDDSQSAYTGTLVNGTAWVSSTITQLPEITSLSANSGTANSTITIYGSGFSNTTTENTVWFGGVKATVTAATETALTVTIPPGASNPVRVYTSTGMAQSNVYFRLTSTYNTPLALGNFTGPTVSYGFAIQNGSYAGLGLSETDHLNYGDFDGDGKLDVLFGRMGVYVQRNTTTTPGVISEGKIVGTEVVGASFEARYYNGSAQNLITEIPSYNYNAAREGDVTYGDVNGDGKLDIVSVVYRPANTDKVVVHINNSTPGSLSFSSSNYNTGGLWARWVKLADLDNDGKLDILVSTSGGGGVVFRNTTVGSSVNFAAIQQLGIIGGEDYIEVADIDKDGKTDIISRGGGGNIKVYRNTSSGKGNISFSTAQTFTVTNLGTSNFAIGDLNNDGLIDILAPANTTISILKNTSTVGSISFGTSQTYTVSASNIAGYVSIGDLDGDSYCDIAFVPNGDYKCYVAKNTSADGTISFDTPFVLNQATNLPQYTAGVAIGDYDGDGDNDVATLSTYTNGINYFSVGSGIPESVTWTGALSTNWNTAGNWNPAVVPTAEIDATIPAVTSPAVYPVVPSGTNAEVKNLTITAADNNSIQVERTGKLTVKGTYSPSANSGIKIMGSPPE